MFEIRYPTKFVIEPLFIFNTKKEHPDHIDPNALKWIAPS